MTAVPEYHAVLQNELAEIGRIKTLVSEFLQPLGDNPALANRLTLMLEELISNIIKYGYDDDRQHEIGVCLSASDGAVTMTIEDDARPYDPRSAPKPDLGADVAKRKVGGLGVFIVREMADDFRYESRNGRNVTTVKRSIN